MEPEFPWGRRAPQIGNAPLQTGRTRVSWPLRGTVRDRNDPKICIECSICQANIYFTYCTIRQSCQPASARKNMRGRTMAVSLKPVVTGGVAKQIATNIREAMIDGRLKVDEPPPTEGEL